MAMVENDRKEVEANGVCGSGMGRNSPWKKPVESSVMEDKSWPALSDVQQPKSAEDPSTNSQISGGHKKLNGGGSGNPSRNHGQPRYHRGGSKRYQNGGPPFPFLYYRAPAIQSNAYGLHLVPAPFLAADNHLVNSRSQIPKKAFVSHWHGMDASQNFQPPELGNQDVNAPNFSAGRRLDAAAGGMPSGHVYHTWQPQWPVGPKGGHMYLMQQNMAPRAHMRRPHLTPPSFVRGPPLPGPGHMHYNPMAPPGSNWAPFLPHFGPQLVNPLACALRPLPPELLALRESIVKQIEYYFSDENLLTDHYLISQMDDQGWVPISIIAGFRRVKNMCTDHQFILDALQLSSSVEVQGEKVRKYGSTSKYSFLSTCLIDSTACPVKKE